MVPVMNNPQSFITHLANVKEVYHGVPPITVEWYFETPLNLKKQEMFRTTPMHLLNPF
jgi:hypothetical protein